VSRVLVTGGAGFVGSHVVDAFLERGDDVVAVDDLSAGARENVSAAADLEELDIRDGAGLRDLFASFGPTIVCHLAAQASVTYSVRHPDEDLETNVRGTFNVCETANASLAPVLFASTGGALYGDSAPFPTPESFPPEPLSPYGASKLAGEAYVATWGRLNGLPNVILRLGNVYGPRQSPHGEAGVVAIFIERLLGGERPTVFGDGEQTRDYIHVTDVGRAFVAAVDSGRASTVNVGTGTETTVNELLRRLQKIADTSVEPQHQPLRPGELKRSLLDTRHAAAVLGWRAEIAVADGLEDTFRSYAARAT
jgi:UDP-glucose 4-epimerase